MNNGIDDGCKTSIEISRHRLAVHEETIDGNFLSVRQTGSAGRGVFAVKPLISGTLINISHTLLFPAKEYQSYGRFTQLDNYTYIWEKTSEGNIMALALGLGSLFNHSYESPNVSYSFDKKNGTIRYTLMKNVNAGEELCISYGSGKMWWEQNDEKEEQDSSTNEETWLSQFAKIDLVENDKD